MSSNVDQPADASPANGPRGNPRKGLRIDLIITELPLGGAERCLTTLAIGLHQRGHRVRVLSLGPPPQPPRDGLVRMLIDAGIPFETAETTSKMLAPLALNRLRRMLLRDRPDVVQTFLFHANVLGTMAAAMAAVPVRVAGIRVAQPRRFRLRLERWMLRKCQAVVCVSRSVAAFASQQLSIPSERLHTIANAVDVARFGAAAPVDWRRFDLPVGARIVLFVGRFDPQKGLERLFAAAPRFLADDPSRHLVLVGDGPLRDWCRAQCEQLPGRRGTVLPWQPDIAPFYSAAELLILTSHYEGMPNVVLEAMAAGRVVVTTDVEGVDELIGEASPQRQIVAHDVEAIAMAVAYWLEHPNEAAKAGRENAARAAEHFGIDAMVAQYQQLYFDLNRSFG